LTLVELYVKMCSQNPHIVAKAEHGGQIPQKPCFTCQWREQQISPL